MSRSRIAVVKQVAILTIILAIGTASSAAAESVSPNSTKWQPMVLQFAGPQVGQVDNDPNPFLDFRLSTTFTAPSGRAYSVPGYFDGDCRGGPTGNVWIVRFTPDEAGKW